MYVTTQVRSIPSLDHLFFLNLTRSDTDAPQVACLRIETNKPESIMDTVILQATFPQRCDALGRIGTTIRKLDWKTPIFFEGAVPIAPNAWYVVGRGHVPLLLYINTHHAIKCPYPQRYVGRGRVSLLIYILSKVNARRATRYPYGAAPEFDFTEDTSLSTRAMFNLKVFGCL